MADITDDATDQELKFTELAIQAARACRPQLPRNGRCHNCEELVEGLFCDADCRQDWEKRQRARR
jgi:hypothetical protein